MAARKKKARKQAARKRATLPAKLARPRWMLP
jgi:hypothetical protein